MPTVDLKLFAGQGTGRTDKAATTCIGSALWRVLSMCLTNKRSNWVEQNDTCLKELRRTSIPYDMILKQGICKHNFSNTVLLFGNKTVCSIHLQFHLQTVT